MTKNTDQELTPIDIYAIQRMKMNVMVSYGILGIFVAIVGAAYSLSWWWVLLPIFFMYVASKF